MVVQPLPRNDSPIVIRLMVRCRPRPHHITTIFKMKENVNTHRLDVHLPYLDVPADLHCRNKSPKRSCIASSSSRTVPPPR